MHPALGGGKGVDLVDDDRLHRAQGLPRLRAQDQVEGLRRRDQDLGRVPRVQPTLLRTGVPRADAYPRRSEARRLPGPEPLGLGRDPGEGGPQVALDVVDQRLERGDVEDANPGRVGRRAAAEHVDRGEEGREGLAAARRCYEERVLAAGQPRPTRLLHGRWSVET